MKINEKYDRNLLSGIRCECYPEPGYFVSFDFINKNDEHLFSVRSEPPRMHYNVPSEIISRYIIGKLGFNQITLIERKHIKDKIKKEIIGYSTFDSLLSKPFIFKEKFVDEELVKNLLSDIHCEYEYSYGNYDRFCFKNGKRETLFYINNNEELNKAQIIARYLITKIGD